MNEMQMTPGRDWPDWFTGKTVNEALFCRAFLNEHRLLYTEDAFFTPDGRLEDDTPLKEAIFDRIFPYVTSNVTKKIAGIIELLKITAYQADFPPSTDRIHLENGTLCLDGRFIPGRPEIVRSRFPVRYDPNAPSPETWLRFLSDLLEPEDVRTLQEYIGYCLLPCNWGQRMMIIKGSGGEGKSQIGAVLRRLFGVNAKDGSIGKVSENRFARADLEHIHLMIDDDMRMDALRQTNYVKSLVTAQGRMDLEKKGRQSYQGWMYARMLAFSNGNLRSLYDRSDGFYRRQLILTAKERPADRVDDPYLAGKMVQEIEGILLWALDGLHRLVSRSYRFSESQQALESLSGVRRDANNVIHFMESSGYIRLDGTGSVSSAELYQIYLLWCRENAVLPMRPRTFSDYLVSEQKRYGILHANTMVNTAGRRVWGFRGITPVVRITEPLSPALLRSLTSSRDAPVSGD